MTPIKTIDDLLDASEAEIEEAANSLRIKDRVIARMEKEGRQTGMTLDAYNERLREIQDTELECPKCHGSGVIRPPKPRSVGCIHPSSSYGCVLRLYHDVVGILEPRNFVPAKLQITFAIGHALHDHIQGVLMRSLGPGRFQAEVPIKMGLVSGHADGDISLETADATLEIKSDGPSSFDSRTAPNDEHVIQAGALYSTALNNPFTVFLYVEKMWPHRIKEYVVPYDRKLFRRWVKKKARPIRDALASGKEPIADSTAAECNRCPYGYEGGCTQNIGKNAHRVKQSMRSRKR